jgi:hypothetical protein
MISNKKRVAVPTQNSKQRGYDESLAIRPSIERQRTHGALRVINPTNPCEHRLRRSRKQFRIEIQRSIAIQQRRFDGRVAADAFLHGDGMFLQIVGMSRSYVSTADFVHQIGIRRDRPNLPVHENFA